MVQQFKCIALARTLHSRHTISGSQVLSCALQFSVDERGKGTILAASCMSAVTTHNSSCLLTHGVHVQQRHPLLYHVLFCRLPAAAGKPVYHIEFSSSAVFAADVCTKQETYGLISVRKEKDLGAFPYVTCPTVAASKLTKAESLTASSIATTFVMLSISGGSLSFTPATNDARLTNFPEPAAKPVFLNGSLTMVGTSGLGLLLGPGIFAVKRQVDWVYDPASKTYTAHTNVEGAVQLVKYAGSGNKNAEKQRSLACNVKGPLRLTSQSYPGPGANGKYNWAGECPCTSPRALGDAISTQFSLDNVCVLLTDRSMCFDYCASSC